MDKWSHGLLTILIGLVGLKNNTEVSQHICIGAWCYSYMKIAGNKEVRTEWWKQERESKDREGDRRTE